VEHTKGFGTPTLKADAQTLCQGALGLHSPASVLSALCHPKHHNDTKRLPTPLAYISHAVNGPATGPLPQTLPSHTHAPQTCEPHEATPWTNEPRTTLCCQKDHVSSRHTCPKHRRQKPRRQRHIPSKHRRPNRRCSFHSSGRQHSTVTHTDASKEHAIEIEATGAHDADYSATYVFVSSSSASEAPPMPPHPRPSPPQLTEQINFPAAPTRATDAQAAYDNYTDDRTTDAVAAAPSLRCSPPHDPQRLPLVPTKISLQTPRASAHMRQ